MNIESPFDLLGLYHGVDLARQSIMDPAALPEMVFLYRRPILDYWAEHEDRLGQIVTHVLVHEIGHHFGLSDADMHRIEEEARPNGQLSATKRTWSPSTTSCSTNASRASDRTTLESPTASRVSSIISKMLRATIPAASSSSA